MFCSLSTLLTLYNMLKLDDRLSLIVNSELIDFLEGNRVCVHVILAKTWRLRHYRARLSLLQR